jgi:hypothetical protein
MILPPILGNTSAVDLHAALEAVDRGGRTPQHLRRTIQHLHVYGFARITVYHHPPVNGLSLVEVLDAELTDRGVELYRMLSEAMSLRAE